MDAHHRRVHILLRGWISAWTHSEVGCLALLPGESSTAAPKKASMKPKDSDSTTSLYLVPSQLLEEQKTGRGTGCPASWGLGQPEASPVMVCTEGFLASCCESSTASSLAPGAFPCLMCLGSDICCCRSHGNMQEAGCWQSWPGKPKAALTPSGKGDEAQHWPQLVFSLCCALQGSEPT